MKLRVEHLIQAHTTASNSWVVKFDFERLEFLKKGCHGESVLCGLTLKLNCGPLAGCQF